MPVSIGKLKFVDFIKASTSVSYLISEIHIWNLIRWNAHIVDYKFVAQDTKFSE